MVKDTLVSYYNSYLEKVRNILTHIDRGEFTEEERQQFVELLNMVYSDQKVKMVKCACGCGQERPQYDSRNRIRKYIYGHSPKGMYG